MAQHFTTSQLEAIQKCRETGDWTALAINFERHELLFMLSVFFDQIPDSQKYEIVMDVYTYLEAARGMSKFLKAIKPLTPAGMLDPIQDRIDHGGNIRVYRGGVLVKNPALSPSWTLSRDRAEWFAKRYLFMGDSVLYAGVIQARDVIAYTDERGEAEIVQYRSVKNIQIVCEYFKTS